MISHFGSNIRKIWIEKIGPLKLFVVLVPGLLCNFGWEVTIKIHYSTVWGGSLQYIYIYILYCKHPCQKKGGFTFKSCQSSPYHFGDPNTPRHPSSINLAFGSGSVSAALGFPFQCFASGYLRGWLWRGGLGIES